MGETLGMGRDPRGWGETLGTPRDGERPSGMGGDPCDPRGAEWIVLGVKHLILGVKQLILG